MKIAYGMSLEAAGLHNAMMNIDTLLDLNYQEKFIEYYPGQAAFANFIESFSLTRFKLMAQLGWNFNAGIFDTDPEHTQSVRDYFENTFKRAILTPETDG